MDSFANLLLEITGRSEGATSELRKVTDEILAFDRVRASAEISVDGEAKAIAKIEALEGRLDAIGDKKLKVDVDVDKVKARLTALRGDLEKAFKAGDRKGIGAAFKEIDRLGHSLTSVLGDVAKEGRTVGEAFSSVASTGVGILFSGLKLLGGAVTTLASQFPLLAAAIAIAPLLIALAGSATAAAEALIGLGAALVGLAGPVVLVVVAIVQRLSAVFKEAGKSAQDLRAQHQKLADAHYAVGQAAQAEALAQQNLGDQAQAAQNARRDSALALVQANQALRDSELGVEDAILGQLDANRALEKFRETNIGSRQKFAEAKRLFAAGGYDARKTAGIFRKVGITGQTVDDQLEFSRLALAARGAQNAVPEARTARQAARNRVSDAAQQEEKFLKRGLLAYGPYAAAIQQAASATHELAAAQRALVQTRSDIAKGTKNFGPVEFALVRQVRSLKAAIGRAISPIVEGALGGFSNFLSGVTKILNDPAVLAGLKAIGDAIGGLFTAFGKFFAQKSTRDEFAKFAQTAADLLRRATPFLVKFTGALLHLADTALPALVTYLGQAGSGVTGFVEGLPKRFAGMKKSLDSVLHFIGATFGLLGALFGGSKKDGDNLFESIAKLEDKAAKFFRSTPGKNGLHDAFKTALSVVKFVYHAIVNIVTFISGTLIPTVKSIAGVIDRNFLEPTRKVLGLLGQILGFGAGKAGGPAGKIIQDIGLVTGIGPLVSAIGSLNKATGGFVSATAIWVGLLAVAARKFAIFGAPLRLLGRGLARLPVAGGFLGKLFGVGKNAPLIEAAAALDGAAGALTAAAEKLAFGGGGLPGGKGGSKGPPGFPGGAAKEAEKDAAKLGRFGRFKGLLGRIPGAAAIGGLLGTDIIGGLAGVLGGGALAAVLTPALIGLAVAAGSAFVAHFITKVPLIGPVIKKARDALRDRINGGGLSKSEEAGQEATLSTVEGLGSKKFKQGSLAELRRAAALANIAQVQAPSAEGAARAAIANLRLTSAEIKRGGVNAREARKRVRELRDAQAKYADDSTAGGRRVRAEINREIRALGRTKEGAIALRHEDLILRRQQIRTAKLVQAAYRNLGDAIKGVLGLVQQIAQDPVLVGTKVTSAVVKKLSTKKGANDLGRKAGEAARDPLGAFLKGIAAAGKAQRHGGILDALGSGVHLPSVRPAVPRNAHQIRAEGAAAGGNQTVNVNLSAPAGHNPDPRASAHQLARQIKKVGR